MSANAKPLAHRQQLFVLAYIANGGNATAAAREAGYTHRTAENAGCVVLRNSNVAAEIARRASKIAKRVEVTVERTLIENAMIAFSDPRRLFDENGKPIPPHRWPDDVAAAIASFDMDENGNITKIRWWNKGDALEKLFKFQRLYTDIQPADRDTTNVLNINFGDLNAEERRQLRQLLARTLSAPRVGE